MMVVMVRVLFQKLAREGDTRIFLGKAPKPSQPSFADGAGDLAVPGLVFEVLGKLFISSRLDPLNTVQTHVKEFFNVDCSRAHPVCPVPSHSQKHPSAMPAPGNNRQAGLQAAWRQIHWSQDPRWPTALRCR